MMSGSNQTACQNREFSQTRNQLAERLAILPTVLLSNVFFTTNEKMELTKHCRQKPSINLKGIKCLTDVGSVWSIYLLAKQTGWHTEM